MKARYDNGTILKWVVDEKQKFGPFIIKDGFEISKNGLPMIQYIIEYMNPEKNYQGYALRYTEDHLQNHALVTTVMELPHNKIEKKAQVIDMLQYLANKYGDDSPVFKVRANWTDSLVLNVNKGESK